MKNNYFKSFKNFFFSYFWLAFVVLGIDLLTKWLVQNNLEENQSITIIPGFFWITKTHNLGGAFSLGANGEVYMRVIFIIISVVMSIAIGVYYFLKGHTHNAWWRVSLTLMLGGAVGNLIDRAFYWEDIVGFKGVIDFIKVTDWFAVFNVADAALVVGVIILIVLNVIDLIKDAQEKAKNGAYSLPPVEYEKKLKELENSSDEVKEEPSLDTKENETNKD